MSLKTALKKTWHFLWHSESAWSWLANLLIAFLVIKFLVYPLLGFLLGTSFPIVAVVSQSMEHGLYGGQLCGQSFYDFKDSFNNYWEVCGDWYEKNNLSPEQFQHFPFPQGFNKGDIILVWGTKPKDLQVGDILIFWGEKPQPLIHRLIKTRKEDGKYYFQTKGDHNQESITGPLGETQISEERLLGKGVLRIPYLGWVKLIFVQAVRPLGWTINR